MNHQARPLTEDEAKHFQGHTLSFAGEVSAAKRETSRVLWAVGVTGYLAWGMAFYISAHFAPLLMNRIENHWVLVDQRLGFVSEVGGPSDAPKIYNERVNEAAVQRYIELREQYTFATDSEHFRLTQELSGVDERARYVAWHKSDEAPLQALKKPGQIETAHFIFFPQGKAPSPVGPFEYIVSYKRRVTDKEDVKTWEDRQVNITIEWHPELLMTTDEVHDNAGGLVVTYYHEGKQ